MHGRRHAQLAGGVLLAMLSAMTAGSPGAHAAGDKRIGVAFDFVTPFRVNERDFVDEALKANAYTMEFSDANRDAQRQASQIDNMLSDGDVAIISIPHDIEAAVAVADTVRAAGVPFVTMDQAPADLNAVSYHVGGDPCADGTIAGQFFVKAADGKLFKLLELQGSLANDNGLRRSSCMNAVIKTHPNIDVVARAPTDWLPEKALTATENTLQAHPDLNGIYGPFNDSLHGVFPALKAHGRLVPVGQPGHVTIVSIDGDPGGCQAVRDKLIDLDIATPLREMGKKAVEAAILLINKGTPAKHAEYLAGLPYGPDDFAQKESLVWGCAHKK